MGSCFKKTIVVGMCLGVGGCGERILPMVVLDSDVPDAMVDSAPLDTAPPIDTSVPDATPDATPDVVANETVNLRFAGSGSADVALRNGNSTLETCRADCDIAVTAEHTSLRVEVRDTHRATVFDRFSGPCTWTDDVRECDVAGPSEVTTQLRDTGAPVGDANVYSSPDNDIFRGLAVGADGSRYFTLSVGTTTIGGTSVRGTLLVGENPDGSIRFHRELSSAYREFRVAVDPTDGNVWVAGDCERRDRLNDISDVGAAGACVGRYTSAGAYVDSQVWPGNVGVEAIAIGADGTIAFIGSLFETVTWDGNALSRSSGTQYYASVSKSPLAIDHAAVVANGATDLPSAVAVGPDGRIYVAGAVRGPRTVGPLSFADIAAFQYQSYLLEYSTTGALTNALRVGSTDVSTVDALAVDSTRVYVAGSYRGQLNAGNTLSREARGISSYPFIAQYTRALAYQWHLDGELWADFISLAPRAGGGVLATARFSDVFSFEEGASGYLVSSDRSSGVFSISLGGTVTWMRQVAHGTAHVATSGNHIAVGGWYNGTLQFPFTPTAAGGTAYIGSLN